VSDEGTSFFREAANNKFLLGVAAIAAIGGFLFGFDTGVIGGAILFVDKDLDVSKGASQFLVAVILIGAMCGALISGWLSDAISRRRTKIVSGSVFVLGAIGSALAQSYWQLTAARFVLGLSVGTASFVSPMYIAELVPKRLRGGVVSFNQLFVTLGIVAAYIVDWGFAGLSNNWRWMFAVGAIPGAALAIGMVFMPFSPRWLVQKGREEEAEALLMRIRDSEDDVREEIDEIKQVTEEEASLRDLLAKAVRPMLVVGLGLAIFQQIVGINTVVYYTPTILKFAGLENTGALQQTVFVGLTNVVFTVVAILLLDRLGRRFFLLAGTTVLTLSLVGLGIFFHSKSLQDGAGWLAVAFLMTYIAGFAIGLGPVFWLMISEIFPLNLRPPAMAVCTLANWAFNFTITYTFLSLVAAIGKPGTFWLYAGFGVAAIAFFAWRVPETKGRSLEEIESELGAEEPQPAHA
jgi:sugar porter (SP) family MFS transporter